MLNHAVFFEKDLGSKPVLVELMRMIGYQHLICHQEIPWLIPLSKVSSIFFDYKQFSVVTIQTTEIY